ncbi:MAG: fasciclin domain-containing protein [Chitinophagales bacterium]
MNFKVFCFSIFAICIAFCSSTSVEAQCSASKSYSHNTSNNHHRSSADIVDIAASSDNLSTLVAAVKAAGLVETLQSDGEFTVFAPTNEAFAALPPGTLESLLKPENKDQLIAVLTYHVLPTKVRSNDLFDGVKVETVQGSDVKANVYANAIKINDATVLQADVNASNGVVHIIDKVILPPSIN